MHTPDAQVAEYCSPAGAAAPPQYLFVSYSGVGAVVSVLVSTMNSTQGGGSGTDSCSSLVGRRTEGALYSSSVSYGCDFILEEEYKCSKLSEFYDITYNFIVIFFLLLLPLNVPRQ